MRRFVFVFAGLAALGAWGADDSWKLPLDVKEKALEQNARDRHNILGLYPSQVEISLDRGEPDYSTLGHCDIAHAVCWSSNYLAGCSFRYAFLKRSGAPADAGWVFAGTPAGLFVSKDTGETWQPAHLVLQFTYNTRREIGGAAYVDAYWRGRYYGFIDDAAAAAPWKE